MFEIAVVARSGNVVALRWLNLCLVVRGLQPFPPQVHFSQKAEEALVDVESTECAPAL